jgi:hypothetical protein
MHENESFQILQVRLNHIIDLDRNSALSSLQALHEHDISQYMQIFQTSILPTSKAFLEGTEFHNDVRSNDVIITSKSCLELNIADPSNNGSFSELMISNPVVGLEICR